MSEKQLLECPVCKSQYDAELSLESCRGCPMAKNCGKVKCPYCGAEFVAELEQYNLSEREQSHDS